MRNWLHTKYNNIGYAVGDFEQRFNDRVKDLFSALRSKVTPSEYTREGWNSMTNFKYFYLFVITSNFTSGILSLTEGKWNEAFLYGIIAGLFCLVLWGQMVDLMARKLIRAQMVLLREQDRLIQAYQEDDMLRATKGLP